MSSYRTLVVAGVLALTVAVLGYCEMFSQFAQHDDEGFLMISIRHVLQGHRLYDDVVIYYGPAYYLLKVVVHDSLGMPLTHNAVRITSLLFLFGSSLMLGIGAKQLTGSHWWSAITAFSAFLYLKSIHYAEPGHPQELIAFDLTLVPIAALGLARCRPGWWAALLGVIAAVGGLCKVNVGLYLVVGLANGILVAAVAGQGVTQRPFIRYLVGAAGAVLGIGLVALPFVVVAHHLHTRWGVLLTLTVSISALGLLAVSWCQVLNSKEDVEIQQSPERYTGQWLIWFLCGGMACSVVVVGIILSWGSTLAGMRESLVETALRMPDAFVVPVSAYNFQLAVALAGLASAMLYVRWDVRGRRPGFVPNVVALAQTALGFLVLSNVCNWGDHSPLRYLCFGRPLYQVVTPFLWLSIVSQTAQGAAAHNLVRYPIAFAAIAQVLQAYPVAGSQMVTATLLNVFLGLVMLYDGLAWLGRGVAARGRTPRRAALVFAWVMAAILPAAAVFGQLPAAVARYRNNVPVELSGAGRLRLPEQQAAVLEFLARLASRQFVTFVSESGLNSLYFWSDCPTPSVEMVCNSIWVLTEQQQKALIDGVESRARPLVMLFRPGCDPFAHFKPGDTPLLVQQLRANFESVGQLAQYELLVRRADDAVPWVDCVTAGSTNGDSQSWSYDFAQATHGREIGRLTVMDTDTGSIVADTSADSGQRTPLCQVTDWTGQPSPRILARGMLRFTPEQPIDRRRLYVVRIYDVGGQWRNSVPVVFTASAR